MNHYQFQLDLDWGYPPALWENFVPPMREWLADLPGFDPWGVVTRPGVKTPG